MTDNTDNPPPPKRLHSKAEQSTTNQFSDFRQDSAGYKPIYTDRKSLKLYSAHVKTVSELQNTSCKYALSTEISKSLNLSTD